LDGAVLLVLTRRALSVGGRPGISDGWAHPEYKGFRYAKPLFPRYSDGTIRFRMTQSDPCPPDPEEAAEARLLDRMPPEQAAAFDLHVAGCPGCAGILEQTRDYIQALRDASNSLASEDSKVD